MTAAERAANAAAAAARIRALIERGTLQAALRADRAAGRPDTAGGQR